MIKSELFNTEDSDNMEFMATAIISSWGYFTL